MKKTLSIILILVLLCQAAGCGKNTANGGAEAVVTEIDVTEGLPAAPAVTAEPTPEPTHTPDPVVQHALGLAEQHGLTADALRGEYELFIEFAETIEGNAALGKFGEFVYLIFPVIADHTEYLDKEYFLNRLSTLCFTVCELGPELAGQFQFDSNEIFISSERGYSGDCELPEIVFHELMHFVDFSINGSEGALYLLNGQRLTPDELFAIPLEERIMAVNIFSTRAVVEGGAELYTAKYFSGAIRWYFTPCEFMTGLEYIYGPDVLDELYFHKDSNAIFAELIFDAGYTEDEYYDIFGMLNWYTEPANYTKPSREIRLEDVLIRLYEHKLGEGWQTDDEFLYILKAINGVAWLGFEESEHADFLRGIGFDTLEKYDAFREKLCSGLPFNLYIDSHPPVPIILGGRFMLTSFASWIYSDAQDAVNGTIALEYDLGAEKLGDYELIDMDAVLEKYFD